MYWWLPSELPYVTPSQQHETHPETEQNRFNLFNSISTDGTVLYTGTFNLRFYESQSQIGCKTAHAYISNQAPSAVSYSIPVIPKLIHRLLAKADVSRCTRIISRCNCSAAFVLQALVLI